ncbi:putative PIF1 helicase-like protein [Trypanosoma cruzi]|nr:putative PIF1 helicase-like protein [Trypanosoma cruzi]
MTRSRVRVSPLELMRRGASAFAAASLQAATNTLIARRSCALLPALFTANVSDGKKSAKQSSRRNEPALLPHRSHVVSPEGEDAFINPFTGRLTSSSSRVAKELLRVGFLRSAVNPFRLTWDAKKWHAAGAAAVKPFQSSMVGWRKNLAALLTREDAADAVVEEVQRLYSELTSAYLPPKLDTMHDPQLSAMEMTPDQENAIRCALRGYNMFVGGGAGTGKNRASQSYAPPLDRNGAARGHDSNNGGCIGAAWWVHVSPGLWGAGRCGGTLQEEVGRQRISRGGCCDY